MYYFRIERNYITLLEILPQKFRAIQNIILTKKATHAYNESTAGADASVEAT